MFRIAEHQADIAVILRSSSRSGFFKSGLEAAISLLTGKDQVQFRHPSIDPADAESLEIASQGADDEERLISLLNELLFHCQVEKWFPLSVQSVAFTGYNYVSAGILALRFPHKMTFQREIKAATYHNLKIAKSHAWNAKVVFDV